MVVRIQSLGAHLGYLLGVGFLDFVFYVLTSVFYTPTSVFYMVVRIQPLGAHLGNLLSVGFLDEFHEATVVGLGVDAFLLLFVHLQHFVHTPLVLQL